MRLVAAGPGEDDRPAAGFTEELADDGHALGFGLSRPVNGLREALAKGAVMVHPGEAEVGIGQAAQAADDLVRTDRAGQELIEEPVQRGLVHGSHAATLWPAGPRLTAGHDHGSAPPAEVVAGPARERLLPQPVAYDGHEAIYALARAAPRRRRCP